MKLNIENKILIPFVFLFLTSLSILMVTSFRNDYKLIIENQFRYMDDRMEELKGRMDYARVHSDDADLIEEEVLKALIHSNTQKVMLVKDHAVLMNTTSYSGAIEALPWENLASDSGRLDQAGYLIRYEEYEPFNWTLVIMANKEELLSYFYESYKYTILTGIIFLTLALQLTILIASNITRPIQKLVRFCAVISKGDYKERIKLKRQDEIGKLGSAFNQMLDQLDTSMNELIHMKNFNQDILNNIEKGIITYTAKEEKISANPFAMQLLDDFEGYALEGKQTSEVLDDMISVTRQTETSQYAMYAFVDGHGRHRYLDCYTSIMWGEEVSIRGYICSFNDITERKKLESRMQRLDRLATAGRLASGMAHEIRNPLAGMRASIQVLNKRLKHELEGSNEVLFDRLINEIDRIDKLISDLLDYSKRKQYQPKKVNLSQSVTDTLALLNKAMETRGIRVEQRLNHKNIDILVDPGHLNQILLNVIKNAMDAVEPSKGRIIIQDAYYPDDPKPVEIQIADNGTGITSEAIEQVFDPFFTTKPDGTGLGLSVVYELVQQNDAEIDIRSTDGEGTRIILRFITGGSFHE